LVLNSHGNGRNAGCRDRQTGELAQRARSGQMDSGNRRLSAFKARQFILPSLNMTRIENGTRHFCRNPQESEQFNRNLSVHPLKRSLACPHVPLTGCPRYLNKVRK
jgi:hypothetical protein